MTTYVTDEERRASSLADLNADQPCGGVWRGRRAALATGATTTGPADGGREG